MSNELVKDKKEMLPSEALNLLSPASDLYDLAVNEQNINNQNESENTMSHSEESFDLNNDYVPNYDDSDISSASMEATLDHDSRPIEPYNDDSVSVTPSTTVNKTTGDISGANAMSTEYYKSLGEIKTNLIIEAPWKNQRKRERKNGAEMLDSIRSRGIDTPLQVRPSIERPGFYELLAGYGRWGCATELNLEMVPVTIHHNCDDALGKVIMASENLDRDELDPVSASQAVADILAEYNGDHAAAVAQTGWTESKFKYYLKIQRCSPKVQEAIEIKQENGFTLRLAHANELALLPHELQDSMCDQIIADKMNASDVKKFLKTYIKRDLETAIFDTTDCEGCDYNELGELDLFSMESQCDRKCKNPVCFQTKETEHLNAKKEELKKDFGTVIFMSEISDNHQEVNETVVGKDKFTNSCLTCTKLAALIQDEGENMGEVYENQCTNVVCANTKEKQLKSSTTKSTIEAEAEAANVEAEEIKGKREKAKAKAQKAAKKGKTEAKGDKETKNEKDKAEPTQLKATVTRGVDIQAKEYLQDQFAEKLCTENSNYGFSVMLMAVRNLNRHQSIDDVVSIMKNHSMEDITKLIETEIKEFSETTNASHTFNGQALVIKAAAMQDGLYDTAKTNWQPTLENLSSMQKGLRIHLMETSGFAKEFRETYGDEAYTKLNKLPTEAHINLMLEFNFDWSGFSPDFINDLMN
ncbi:ParB/RepB/Spo0J family partition protein [Vibrio barjaei]|uniref:ParB/RepB/Spo0J family partition protein n=1 Tax=Vibrio barjaei TaxID=1676683 RepID=UPI002284F60F|nr:ParB/RepB/Spo0J family partition protein [Vibrio barjaei]MCY9870502.1 ParB/RepB/Spo0J family partition protein [Vibrio barjaei]